MKLTIPSVDMVSIPQIAGRLKCLLGKGYG